MKNLILKLIKKYLLAKPTFHQGDLVKHRYADEVYEVSGMFYTLDLKLVIFIRDVDGRIYEKDPNDYIKYGGIARI